MDLDQVIYLLVWALLWGLMVGIFTYHHNQGFLVGFIFGFILGIFGFIAALWYIADVKKVQKKIKEQAEAAIERDRIKAMDKPDQIIEKDDIPL